MNQSGHKWIKWSEVERMGRIELNGNKVDRIEPKWIE